MGIEQSGGKHFLNSSGVSKKKKKQRKPKRFTSVQKLYETCEDVFADCGPHVVPSTEKLLHLATVLVSDRRSDRIAAASRFYALEPLIYCFDFRGALIRVDRLLNRMVNGLRVPISFVFECFCRSDDAIRCRFATGDAVLQQRNYANYQLHASIRMRQILGTPSRFHKP
ncbi:hypothetical protein M569_05014 [Genlisea aurea]|uniref:Uncharacterized protein n=1 Tax=Genlisea aurea TaxID=192259 RepID=S8CXJ4_9LAMI|nr:hypothetical protein M569_05014 [Genlisea aurea]